MVIPSEYIQIISAGIYSISLFFTVVTFWRTKRLDQITLSNNIFSHLRDLDIELAKIPAGTATVPGAPRPFITVEKDATGTTDITNPEIAYLGYEKGSFSGVGTAGLNYYGGDGSILRDNNIHHLYFGFYSSGVAIRKPSFL